MQDNSQIEFDADNYILINGIKTCRVLPGNILEFEDRNRLRRSRNGGRPQVGLLDLVKALAARQPG
jgi:hypothetical protein